MNQQCIITLHVSVSIGSETTQLYFSTSTKNIFISWECLFFPPKCVHVCRPASSVHLFHNILEFHEECLHVPLSSGNGTSASFNAAAAFSMRHLFYVSVSECFYITINNYCCLTISVCHFPLDWVESVRWSATHCFQTQLCAFQSNCWLGQPLHNSLLLHSQFLHLLELHAKTSKSRCTNYCSCKLLANFRITSTTSSYPQSLW